jgi:ATP-binding cassette subfamily F protein 3
VIVSGVSLSIAPGARLGILGRNGAGKSTVIKSIAGQITPIAGQVTAATDLEVGFFAQLEVDQLDARSSAFAELTHRGGLAVCDWSEQQKRDHLGRFGFQGERAFEPIVNFSGGERARLSLAILVARRPNLLLLDEPTNHLDLEMRDALLLALQDFTGAVVLVSHDRGLLGSVCDEFVVVKDGKVEPFGGDLDDYADWLTQQSRGPVDKSAAEERRSRRREEAEARNQLAPLRAELKKIEKDLEQLSTTRDLLEAKMADPVLCQSVEAAKVWPLEHATLQKRIDELEERWLVLGTELESRGV